MQASTRTHDLRLPAALLMASLAFVVVPGCSDPAVKIAGTVTVDGVPVEQGVVLFRPADGKGATAEAAIDNGSYSLSVTPGTKRVLIQGFKITGEVKPWGPHAPSAPVLEPVVPECYYDNSDINVEIDVDNDALDFAIDSTAKAKRG